MRWIELMHSVLLNIKSSKFRVFLTSLGIIIGTFTIIMVVGIGKASEEAVVAQYKRLSASSITITSNMRGSRFSTASSSKTVTMDQMLAMPQQLQDVKSVGVSVRTSSQIAYDDLSENISMMGTNEAYAEITNLTPMVGDYFTDYDSSMRNRVAVLGYNVANELFNGDFDSAVGSTVMIKGVTFKVVGVLERIGGSGGIGGSTSASTSSDTSSGTSSFYSYSSSADDMAFIPYDVAVKYATGSSSRGNFSNGATASYIALANDIGSVQNAISEIKEYLTEITGSDSSYSVVDAGSTLQSAQQTSRTMAALLMAVAAIVLFVSGIGIMNVMMTSVKERTHEIGILMAIGAVRRDILLEFLLEAAVISLNGGILGLVLSLLAPYVLSIAGIGFSASLGGLLLGIVFSVLTGVFFGYYPAVKASRLKPIDALNYE